MLPVAEHPAESTHFYDRSGRPAYEVPNKSNGGMRPTTVRDARVLQLVPSVTTVIKMQDRPGLNNWSQDQAILAALTLPRRDGEAEGDWLVRVRQDSRAQARAAADHGTLIHEAIGRYYESGGKVIPTQDMYQHVKGAVLCLRESAPRCPWVSERSFVHQSGFGGKCDLSSPAWVVDFKGKDYTPEDRDGLKTWDEHAQQLAAYREGLGIGPARCAILYFSRTHPGLSHFIEVPEADLRRGWEMFAALLAFWKAKNRYDSAFERMD